MAAKNTDKRTSICQSDFVVGLCRALYVCGFRTINAHRDRTFDGQDYAFDLSMKQAFEFLEARYAAEGEDDNITFRIQLDQYGMSPGARDELGFLMSLRMAHYQVPGDGTIFLDMPFDSADRALEREPIGRELLIELAHRFMREYQTPREEREWP